jgi:hypothetical protein
MEESTRWESGLGLWLASVCGLQIEQLSMDPAVLHFAAIWK